MIKFIAHRGASVEAQENTLEAIRLGATLGAYACEADLRITAALPPLNFSKK